MPIEPGLAVEINVIPRHVEAIKRAEEFDVKLRDLIITRLRRLGKHDTTYLLAVTANLDRWIAGYIDPMIHRIVAKQDFRQTKANGYLSPPYKEFKPTYSEVLLTPDMYNRSDIPRIIDDFCSAIYGNRKAVSLKAAIIRNFLTVNFTINPDVLNGTLPPLNWDLPAL